jgi:endonuclease/exonuclease/phosphatase family metal-dependent hydrolase
MIWWLFIKRRYALISGIALLLGFNSVTAFYGFHFAKGFRQEKNPKAIRIATWNVARFIEMKRNNNKGSQTRKKMMEQIRDQDADILCLQEFYHSDDSTLYPNLNYVRDSLGYPYHYYSYERDGDKQFTGNIIFSRYPIIDSGLIRYPRPSLPEALMHVDIRLKNRIIRVYTTHLQSVQLKRTDYEKIDQIKEGEDGMVSNSKTIFFKVRRAIENRKIQTDIIAQLLGDSPYPVIFCGDLNDIPNSYTYFNIRGEMQDAFLKAGFGIGRTFSAISPTLRIDYIFADRRFRIHQFKRIVRNYSDHYMLVSDIELKINAQ